MKIHKARKNHRCSSCGRLIPAGCRYWRDDDETHNVGVDKQHTNCLDYEHERIVSDNEVRVMNKPKVKK